MVRTKATPPKGNLMKAALDADKKKGKTRKVRIDNFRTYIHELQKSIAAENGMTEASQTVFNDLSLSVIRMLVDDAEDLRLHSKKKSMKNIINAIRLRFPAALSNAALDAIDKHDNEVAAEVERRAAGIKGTRKVDNAGLTFSVTRVEHNVRALAPGIRVKRKMCSDLTATVEYIISEVIKGSLTKIGDATRITPRSILLALESDADLKKLFKSFVMQGGVLPAPKEEKVKKATPTKGKKTTPTKGKKATPPKVVRAPRQVYSPNTTAAKKAAALAKRRATLAAKKAAAAAE